MFTGLIESIGTIKTIKPKENYLVMTAEHALTGDLVKVGDSISCDGACLTVVAVGSNEFTFEISQETIAKTISADYTEGTKINLERAVRVGDRLGGHFVSGHVDTIAEVKHRREDGESVIIDFSYDSEFDKFVVNKGSVSINGVSLTVNESSPGTLSVNLIPHTLKQTNLERLKVHNKVNIEFDLIGKYALNSNSTASKSEITNSKLIESGW